MTKPSNATEKPEPGCGCESFIDGDVLCPEAQRLLGVCVAAWGRAQEAHDRLIDDLDDRNVPTAMVPEYEEWIHAKKACRAHAEAAQ